MTLILAFSEKHIFLGIFIRIACYIALKLIYVLDQIKASIRRLGYKSKRFSKLYQLKNIHDGKRCFVLCTGPSLTIKDCELLQDEITFCMNSFCKILEKTNFRPSFYGIQDVQVFSNLKEDIFHWFKNKENVLIADRITQKYKLDNPWVEFPLCYSYNAYERWFKSEFIAKFSPDSYRIVYDEFSITHSLIQIAVYMGFKEIYLLGADCSFNKNKPLHFVDHGIVDSQIDTSRDRNIAGYKAIKNYCDLHGIKVFNATRGGKLEVFPRVQLETVLKENKE